MRLNEYFQQPDAMTKSEMARRIGKSRSYITRVCGGKITPSLPVSLLIRQVTNGQVEPDDLVPGNLS